MEKIGTILFGAGQVGKIAFYSLLKKKIDVDYVYDSDIRKHGEDFCGKKVLSKDEFEKISKSSKIYISNNYIKSVSDYLTKNKFTNFIDCNDLFENLDLEEFKSKFTEYEWKNLKRDVSFHISSGKKISNPSNSFTLKCLDIVVTERCSMKCKDCSNLMQYYEKPGNSDVEILFNSLDKLMSVVDQVYEFRVLGGDPFMNKELHKYVNRLVEYRNVENVVLYTNATILPKNENLECLKNPKISLEITNYGPNLSRKHDELLKLLENLKIEYRTRPPGVWNDCGKLEKYERTEEELQRVFDNCCMNDVPSLLNGVIYKCPYSANATNLKAVPFVEDEVVDLTKNYEKDSLKEKLKKFHLSEKPLTACNYCGGRDYKSKEIEPAIQVKKSLKYNRIV